MEAIEIHSENLPPQSHNGHRIIDVTAAGHIHPRRLCLDCKVEYEERLPPPDREWMGRIA